MALRKYDGKFIKVVQATHHQGDMRYGMSRVCSARVCYLCQFVGHYLSLKAYGIPLMQTVYYRMVIFCLNISIYADIVGCKTYHRSFLLNILQYMQSFLTIEQERYIFGAYFAPITEIVSGWQQIDTGALLIINMYILGLLSGNQCFFYLTHIAKVKLEEFLQQLQQFC